MKLAIACLLFSGARYQQGYELENIFSSLAKTVLPLVKSGAKAIGKQVLHSEVSLASDLLRGKSAKQAAINCAKAGGSNLLKAQRTGQSAKSQGTKEKTQVTSRHFC